MPYPDSSENTFRLAADTVDKYKEALKITGDPTAASNLVLADTLRQTNEQLYKCGWDMTKGVWAISKER